MIHSQVTLIRFASPTNKLNDRHTLEILNFDFKF